MHNTLLATDHILTPAPLLSAVHIVADTASVSSAETRLFLGLLLAYSAAPTWLAIQVGHSGLHRDSF